ncbi:MAG: amidohydrolase [Phycisphaeraceae bacterium]
MQQRIFDSHHHLWDYDPKQYPWIPKHSAAAHSYNLDDLAQHCGPYDVQSTIAVHARQTLEENEWLIEHARNHKLCSGVVGWVPMLDDHIDEVLAHYEDEPLFKGVRYALQNEKDPNFMLSAAFMRGLKAISRTNLRYDILIFGRQLPNTIMMVDRMPEDMPFVLDHIAKPTILPSKFDEQWASDVTELAKRPNVMCKLSGMMTEVQADVWSISNLKPYFEIVLQAFGHDRLMFGSDWPVCLLKADYVEWIQTVLKLIHGLSEEEQDKILYRNAVTFYM